ncbi:hypothetical protein VTI74DRAFT_8015 [Chaetomium olivicolor]
MKKAWVSLLAAEDSSSRWIQYHEVYHDDSLEQQPAGQVDIYLSDFVGRAGVPAAYCRPSTAEPIAGTTRNPTITMTYERLRAIFRKARYLHDPKEFPPEVGDEEENLYEEMERRLAEERIEMERRLAEERMETERRVAEARNEERIEMERRLAEERIEMERHIAAEIERRMALEITRRVAAGCSEAGQQLAKM